MGDSLNLENPQKYSEKVQWLKLHDRKPEYSVMVDKYAVQKYIADKLGEQYLIPCYGVWEHFEDIDFDTLPNEFVLKCTHDSGSVIICKDKASFDKEAARKRIKKAYGRSFYSAYREWPYKNVKPRIIAEKFMVDESGNDLKDYKVMCFGGRAELIKVHQNRFNDDRHTQDFYDRNWNNMHIVQKTLNRADWDVERPKNLEELLRLSEVLAKDMKHARIDWYVIGEAIYFGEITFYSSSGLIPFDERGEKLLGDLLQL
ncbi:MAG: glycosyl transferase [Lachnospiraceae bacterium]|nr:glycosyl transferase [Lachnospiraceae bacterium]